MGYADAIKAATLIIVSRKLDEVRTLLVASGFSNTLGVSQPTPISAAPAPPVAVPSPPPKNPCVHCGRDGIYKSKPSQWNRTGSWFCRAHMPYAGQIEADDRMDRSMNFNAPPAAPPAVPSSQQPAVNTPAGAVAGASSLAEAMGMAEIVDEQS